jgi:hypothetical protein
MALSVAARADIQLFTNPGFEAGNLSGWSLTSTAGSDDAFFASNAMITPLNGFPTVGPAHGNWYAVSDMSGLVTPESTALVQTLTLPTGTTKAVLSLNMFVNDQFGAGGLGGEVAIWKNGVNPLTTAPLFVVFGPTDTGVASGVPNPWVSLSKDITADLIVGTAYEIGVLESDQFGPINVGVDDFSLLATVATTPGVPEPSALLLLGSVAGLLVYQMRARLARKS